MINTYRYPDATGAEAFQILRYEWMANGKRCKEFRVRHYVKGEGWVFRAPPKTYPYRVDLVSSASDDDIVYIVEGEKCADAIISRGGIATTNPFGAGTPKNWKPEYAQYFSGKTVVLIPDTDEPGMRLGEAVWESVSPVVARGAMVRIKDLGEKEDVFDWFGKGGTLEALHQMAREALDSHPAQKGDAYEPPADKAKPDDFEEMAATLWRPFPLGAFPRVLRDFVRETSRVLNVDPAYVALPVFVTAACAIGAKKTVRLLDGWNEPAVIWGALIAESGTMKSPSMDAAVAPLKEVQKEFAAAYRKEEERWRIEMDEYQKSLKGRGKKIEDDLAPSEPEAPQMQRIIVQDVTIEKLGDLNLRNPQGLFLCRDELAGWIGSFTRYKDGKGGGSDVPNWLEIFRGGDVLKDRKGGDKPTIWVPRSFVGVFGTIQPKIFVRMMNQDLFDSGLVARLLFVMPPKQPKVLTRVPVPETVRNEYKNVIKTIYKEEFTIGEDGAIVPQDVQFSPCGDKAFEDFYNHWGQRQWNSDGEHAAALAKLEAYCFRFALVLACVEFASGDIPKLEITGNHVANAFALVDWFAYEVERVYSMIRKSPEDESRDRILRHIHFLEGSVTPRDLFRSNPSRYGNTQNTLSILEDLVIKKFLVKQMKPSGPKGGRPTMHYCLPDLSNAKKGKS